MNITPENIFEVHSQTLDAVYENDYYINILDSLLNEVSSDNSEINTAEDIVNFWNRFWFALPDNKAIHRNPFYQICDICEFDYREDFDEEEVAF